MEKIGEVLVENKKENSVNYKKSIFSYFLASVLRFDIAIALIIILIASFASASDVVLQSGKINVSDFEVQKDNEAFIDLKNTEAGGGSYAIVSSGSSGSFGGAGKFVVYERIADQDRLTIDANGNVGVGTTIPTQKLDVDGQIHAIGDICTEVNGKCLSTAGSGAGIPSGMIAFFAGACPAGWTEYTTLQGRVIVGVPAVGLVGGTVGAALSNLENRAHTHPVDPPNTGTSSNGAHQHGIIGWGGDTPRWFGDDNGDNQYRNAVDGDHSHSVDIGSFNSGATTDVMPYIQLRACIAP